MKRHTSHTQCAIEVSANPAVLDYKFNFNSMPRPGYRRPYLTLRHYRDCGRGRSSRHWRMRAPRTNRSIRLCSPSRSRHRRKAKILIVVAQISPSRRHPRRPILNTRTSSSPVRSSSMATTTCLGPFAPTRRRRTTSSLTTCANPRQARRISRACARVA
jgi:hypothetical protein